MKKSKIINLIGAFFAVMIVIILGVCILGQDIIYRYRKEFLLDNYICVLLGLVIYAGFLGIAHICVKKSFAQKHLSKIMLGLAAVFTAIIFVMSYHYSFRTGWDVSYLLNTAEGLVYNQPEKVMEWYYSTCQNNILLVGIYTFIYKIATIVGIDYPYFVLLFLQSAIFSWVGYFIYRIADMIFGEEKVKYTILAWFIYMALVGISPWVVIPYSDVATLFTVTLDVFLVFRIYKKGATFRNVFGAALCGFIGFYIKPQSLIFLIAVTFITLITNFKQVFSDYKNTCKKIAAIVLAYIVAMTMVQGATHFCGFDIQKENKFGITHYLMTGLNRDSCGTISVEDVDISSKEPTYDARCKANLTEISRRVEEMGIGGLLELAVIKTLVNYNDGTFGWGVEGNFYAELYEIGNDFLRYFLRGFYYEGLNHYEWFTLWMQMLWMGSLCLSVFAIKSIQDKRVATLILSIIGLTMFELIFEARARYLFAYAPVYILLAVIGIKNIMAFFGRMRK